VLTGCGQGGGGAGLGADRGTPVPTDLVPEHGLVGQQSLAGFAVDVGWVAAMLDACPNYSIDFSARIGELGRQPYTARRFFMDYADRIVFGTDISPSLDAYRLYYRFLESDDEYFNYGLSDPPGQGRWRIYGLHLPDDVLHKVYYQNAARILLGLQDSL
jgi:predicted TIM-barrel fold metal-dependent hydrolase